MAGSRNSAVDAELDRIWREAVAARSPMPTELELARELGVSRPLVRESLIRLEARGLVSRRAHQGTFPNLAAGSVPFRIDQSYELTARLTEAGYTVQVDVLSSGWSTVAEHEAADLEVEPGAPCHRVVKVWHADGRPLIMAADVVPARRRDDVEFDPEYSVFETVNRLRGTQVEWESAVIGAVLPDARVREQLEVSAAEPVLTITVVGISLHGDRLYRGNETHRTDGPDYGMIRRSADPL